MFQILLKTAQELERTDINFFKNTKATKSTPAFQSENSV